MKVPILFLFIGLMIAAHSQDSLRTPSPLRLGIVGLSHSHVHGLLGREDRGDIQIVGIAEADPALAERLMSQYGLPKSLWFASMDEMLLQTRPEAVAAFNSIYEHREVVRACAPKGIHVMVEKPLAVSLEHAEEMARLAEVHQIHLLTNYETSWYATHFKAYELLNEDKAIGPLLKLVVHDGHPGPKEIGVNQEFLDWLTDPRLNGGGALMDFGCYGANLLTWLNQGQSPYSVMAVTQQFKPEVYPKVDDEATIIVTYPKMQAIIQASWNWPYNRKDLEIYGKYGYIKVDDRKKLRLRMTEELPEVDFTLEEPEPPFDDPFSYFFSVVRGQINVKAYDLSALPNNVISMQILDAAKESARTGRVIYFD